MPAMHAAMARFSAARSICSAAGAVCAAARGCTGAARTRSKAPSFSRTERSLRIVAGVASSSLLNWETYTLPSWRSISRIFSRRMSILSEL